ncbi:MAG TPA: alpha/beta family hydrolase [Acidimicrobiales bacterium]|nr:alpha/beta family hydrolase [Acidimicrobiales bacterium]
MAPKKTARPAGLLLAPGAGAGSDQPSLVALDEAVTAAGLTVARIDFPYRLAGRSRPDKPAVLEETIRSSALALADRIGVDTGALLLGGRSMGGRICSQVVAAGLAAAGLALISYPLHPPGRPDKPRTAHLGAISVPCLFISGTRDAFGTPDELMAAAAEIPGPVSHVWIEGGDHSLRRKDAAVVEAVLAWLASV